MRALVTVLLLAGCAPQTALVSFTAVAGGPMSSPRSFETPAGFHLELERARLHVGAVYLNDIVHTSGLGETSCTLPSGIYVAEAFPATGSTFDLLSSELTVLSDAGEGIAEHAGTAEVWLTGGDVNALSDSQVILDVAGEATGADGGLWHFESATTISSNRALSSVSAAQPGANPICHQRIVTPIATDVTLKAGGRLELRVDPRPMFQAVRFATDTLTALDDGGFQIPDTQAGAGQALFKGLLSNAGVYDFQWSHP